MKTEVWDVTRIAIFSVNNLFQEIKIISFQEEVYYIYQIPTHGVAPQYCYEQWKE